MSKETQEQPEWIGHGYVKIGKGVGNGRFVHIKAKIRDELEIEPGDLVYQEVNKSKSQIRLTVVERAEKE